MSLQVKVLTALSLTATRIDRTGIVVTVNRYFTGFTSSLKGGGMDRRYRRQITHVDMALGAGAMYVDEDEITLEAGDRIQAKANSTINAVHYLISGVERDI